MMVMLAKLPTGQSAPSRPPRSPPERRTSCGFEIHGDQGGLALQLHGSELPGSLRSAEPDAPLGGARGWRKIACVQRYAKPGGFPGPKFSIGWIRAHTHSLYNFLQAVATVKQPQPSLQDGLHLQRLLSVRREVSSYSNLAVTAAIRSLVLRRRALKCLFYFAISPGR